MSDTSQPGEGCQTQLVAVSYVLYSELWAKSRKYNMVQKQKIHAEANPENTSGPHDVGRPSAGLHHMVAAADAPGPGAGSPIRMNTYPAPSSAAGSTRVGGLLRPAHLSGPLHGL